MPKTLHVRLAFQMFLQFFIWGSYFVTLGTYLLTTLHFSGQEVGLVYGTTAIAAMVSPFLLGMLADRHFPVEKLLSILNLSGAALLLSASYFETFWPFYPLILLYTFTYMPTFSLNAALCFHHLQRPTRDFPRVRSLGTFGWIVAGLLVGYLDIETEVTPMYIGAGASFFAGIYSLTLPKTPPQGNKVSMRDWIGPEVRKLFRDRSFTILMLIMVLVSIPIAFYYSFVNPYLNEIGIENAAGKMSLGQVSEIMFMLILPWFINRFGLKVTIFIGLFTWGARYLLFAYGDSGDLSWVIYTAILLHGLAFVFSGLSVQIYLNERVPVSLRSTAQGFYTFLTLGLGTLIGSFLAGNVVTLFTTSSGAFLWQKIWYVPSAIGILVSIYFVLRFKAGKVKVE
ncbi:MFS transporter [Flavilitoribacter nigricans]|uniref:MFS transporter n=1 Tax=Flavilitoribacter nigricans (strain ATCC 23147 / DSM 23189 / NBRC 102662 / NCIMB 1420 / SS-2) TaxID=1122177 RepID=A0A2D0N0P9_FLAN2|nr:MFS transporter [Flavilitoribacter nigricans]PHN01719.1 MFS transporter [Flavilitoribacter nigricans DSM 23189 = NBRC 102662]